MAGTRFRSEDEARGKVILAKRKASEIRVVTSALKLREDEVESIREAKFWLELRIQLADGHPNPKRIGCPCVSALQRGANVRNLDPRMSQHLFRCSPCYRVYSRFLGEWLAELRSQHPHAHNGNGREENKRNFSVRASGSRS